MVRFEFTRDSTITLEAKSSVHPIHGETHEVTGEASGELQNGKIVLNPQPSGFVQMNVDVLKSGHKLQDMEMKRRVEAKKFPTIRYELAEASGGPEKFVLKGTLTFHGVTKEFAEDVTATVVDGRLLVEGEHTFNIEEFGVKAPKILSLQVYPDVTIKAKLVGKEI